MIHSSSDLQCWTINKLNCRLLRFYLHKTRVEKKAPIMGAVFNEHMEMANQTDKMWPGIVTIQHSELLIHLLVSQCSTEIIYQPAWPTAWSTVKLPISCHPMHRPLLGHPDFAWSTRLRPVSAIAEGHIWWRLCHSLSWEEEADINSICTVKLTAAWLVPLVRADFIEQ